MNEITIDNLPEQSHDDLLAYAKDELGLAVPSNIKKAKLIDKIKAELGVIDTQPADIAEDETVDDANDYDATAAVYNPKLKAKLPNIHHRRDVKMVTINIPETEGVSGSDDVQVNVQGKQYLIKRNEDVKVPYFIVEALNNAIETRYIEKEVDGKRIHVERKVMSYPFRVVG